MKTKKDKENKILSLLCGTVLLVFILFIIMLGSIINLALAAVDKETKNAIDYSKRIL